MRRIAKWLLIGLGGLLVVVIVFIAAVVVLVDPNDYRDEIAQTVERQTGRQLTIDGELGLTFFPWLGLEAGSMSLADAPGFGSEPFVQVDAVQLAVKVLPLLSGELMLDTVVLDRPQIRMLRNEQGEGNWEQLGKGSKKPEQAPAEESGDGGVPAVLQNASLEGVEINEARVVYEDRQANTSAMLDPLNLTLTDVRFGEPVEIEGDWQASLKEGPTIGGELAMTASVNKDLTSAAAKDIELDVEATGDTIPGGSQTATAQGQLQANLAKAVYQLTGLTVEAAGAVLEGQAEARLMGDDPVATGRLTVPEANPRDILEQLAIEPPPTRDGDVLSRLAAQIEFRFADGQLQLKPLNATLDDSKLAGEALIRDFAAPAANFDLNLDEIDVDRYLPPKSEQTGEDESTPPSSPGGAAGGGAGELPIETLRRLDLKGRVHIDSLKVSGASASDINIGITAKDGRIRVNPLAAALYQGKYSGDLRLDVSGEQPMISVDEQLTGIQVGPLLADVADFDQLLGTGDFEVKATSRGLEPEPLLQALKGQAEFAFNDGTVKGINIAQTLRSAMAQVTGGGGGQTDAPQETDFSSLTGTLRFDEGVVRNPDLSAKSPLLRIDGKGEANVVKRTLDYLLTVNVVGTLEGQGGQELQQLKGAPVPLRLKGSLTSPGVSVDVQQALQALAGERLDEKEAELREKLKDKQGDVEKKARKKVEDQVQDKLKGLLGN